jgi:short-subunit dehydrogenase
MDKASFLTRFGPWALVAGASQGLGAEYARQLAQRGLNLVLVARRADALEQVAAEVRKTAAARYTTAVEVRTIAQDLALPDAAQRIAAQTEGLEIGLLVLNAAYAPVAPFFDLTLDQQLRSLDTNIRTPLGLIYAYGPAMRARRRGGMVVMSSLSATQGSALISNYAATKAYLLTLAEGLWEEFRADGVTVTASLPASIATPNYLGDLPDGSSSPTQALSPAQVARETLAALAQGQPSVIPGWNNRLAAFALRRLMPRKFVIQMMGRIMRGMYAK